MTQCMSIYVHKLKKWDNGKVPYYILYSWKNTYWYLWLVYYQLAIFRSYLNYSQDRARLNIVVGQLWEDRIYFDIKDFNLQSWPHPQIVTPSLQTSIENTRTSKNKSINNMSKNRAFFIHTISFFCNQWITHEVKQPSSNVFPVDKVEPFS